MHLANVLIGPIITEKGSSLSETGKYMFKVNMRASKLDIARAVTETFKVNTVSVNTMIVKGKTKSFGGRTKRQPNWKKAIVTLAPGQSLQLFEGT